MCTCHRQSNMAVDADVELASLSLTLLPNGESGQWQRETGQQHGHLDNETLLRWSRKFFRTATDA